MDRFFGKTFSAFSFAMAIVKFAFCTPLQSDDAFESRLSSFRRGE